MSWAESRMTPSQKSPNARQIRHELKQISPDNSHPQRESPLFTRIPPEIRNQIFILAVSQHDDGDHRHTSNYYPKYVYENTGWQYRKRTYTELLRTCRLIYYETNALPMANSIHFMPKDIATRGWGSSYEMSERWINHLTAKNVVELDHIHCFGGLHAWHHWVRLPQFQPQQITHSVPDEQWRWNPDDPLCLFNALTLATNVLPVSLHTYRLELYVRNFIEQKGMNIFHAQLAKVPDMHTITLPNGRTLKISMKETNTLVSESSIYIVSFVFDEQGASKTRGKRPKKTAQPTKVPCHLNKFEYEAIEDNDALFELLLQYS